MVGELPVKLVKGRLAQSGVAFLEKRRVRALREFDLVAVLVADHAELHVHVGQLRKRLAVARQRGAPESKQPFLRFGKDVRLEAAQLFQADFPWTQRRVGQETRKRLVGHGLDFGGHERPGLVDAGEQILELRHAREIVGVAAVLGVLQRGVAVQAFDLEAELLFKFQRGEQFQRGAAEFSLEFSQARVIGAYGLEVGLPGSDARVERG